ncbi:MAG TPA: DOMON-like domain-containing protein [Pseudolabrys sp.]|nr:DOMON-like domain-containing protein [Pseudolabrys sp.]
MRQVLKLHPDSRCGAAIQIEVEIARPRVDRLALSYIVTGKIDDIRMPPLAAPARSEKLWQQTCFEAFVRASTGDEYYEFNFSPSTQWAAYRFSGYRSEMRLADEIDAPEIEVRFDPHRFTLSAALALERLSVLPRKAAWRLGLSALIEDKSGDKSYWALAHPPGKPDFHHADCFAYEFLADGRS